VAAQPELLAAMTTTISTLSSSVVELSHRPASSGPETLDTDRLHPRFRAGDPTGPRDKLVTNTKIKCADLRAGPAGVASLRSAYAPADA
jgi:hypothetical protein